MARATLTSKGQLTLPKEIRDRLGVAEGDLVEFRTGPDGRVWVEPASEDLLRMRGLFGPVKRARSQEELDDAVRRGATGRGR